MEYRLVRCDLTLSGFGAETPIRRAIIVIIKLSKIAKAHGFIPGTIPNLSTTSLAFKSVFRAQQDSFGLFTNTFEVSTGFKRLQPPALIGMHNSDVVCVSRID